MTTNTTLRLATLADAQAIAQLHVAVWRETYRDLAPPDALATLDEARRLASWRVTLTTPPADTMVVVAEINSELVGFGMCGPAAHPAFGGWPEIKNLYVATRHQRCRIGHALMAAMAHRLAGDGADQVALGVVVGNTPALEFYRALGGQISGTYTDPGPLWRSENHRIVWDDIQTLIWRASSAR